MKTNRFKSVRRPSDVALAVGIVVALGFNFGIASGFAAYGLALPVGVASGFFVAGVGLWMFAFAIATLAIPRALELLFPARA